MIKVIGRKWPVQNDFKSSSSVITSIAHMETRTHFSSEAAPSSWQKYDTDSKSLLVEKLKKKTRAAIRKAVRCCQVQIKNEPKQMI